MPIPLSKAVFYFAKISGSDVVACICALMGQLVVLKREFDVVKSGIATEPPRAVSSALAKFRLAIYT